MARSAQGPSRSRRDVEPSGVDRRNRRWSSRRQPRVRPREGVSPSRPRCVLLTHRLSQPSFAGRSRRALRGRRARRLVRFRGGVHETERSTHHLPLPSRTSLLGIVDPLPNQSEERADRDESTTQDQGHGVSLSLWVLRESVRLTTFGPQGRKSQVVTHDNHAAIDLQVRADFRRCGPDSPGRWASWAGADATGRARCGSAPRADVRAAA